MFAFNENGWKAINLGLSSTEFHLLQYAIMRL